MNRVKEKIGKQSKLNMAWERKKIEEPIELIVLMPLICPLAITL